MRLTKPVALAAVCLPVLASCTPQYTPVAFNLEGGRIVATGAIDASTLEAFTTIARQNPEVQTLLLRTVEGSVDDEANLVFSRVVREQRFDTIVPADGLIASGGTDLFLAGNRRTLEQGACVGVHSWGGGGPPAAELPRDHHDHLKYLDYYRDLEVDTEFYWFTLTAAPASDMHWMTAEEADRFGLTTDPSPELGDPDVCEARLLQRLGETVSSEDTPKVVDTILPF